MFARLPVLFAVALASCATPAETAPAEKIGAQAFLESCEDWDDWDKPAPPFHIFGGTYYVGTCGITAILITGDDGHMVIDSGTKAGAVHVASNIERLGFALEDVRFVTHTQEHNDHIGGIGILRQKTDAKLVASERARSVFETGLLNTDDPQFEASSRARAPRPVDRIVSDGEAIELSGKSVVARYTPGHSPGAISWRWTECEDGTCRSLLFSDGLGPFSSDGYRWSDHPQYLSDYLQSIAWLTNSGAEICLSAHPSQMRMLERLSNGAIVDRDECRRAGEFIKGRVDAIIAEEARS